MGVGLLVRPHPRAGLIDALRTHRRAAILSACPLVAIGGPVVVSAAPPTVARHGVVARLLHWVTVLALVAQLLVGYTMTGGGGPLDGWVDSAYDGDEDLLLPLHMALGLAILALAVVRLAWRLITTLPPWPPTLTPRERRFATVVERSLYALLFVVPLTGLALVLGSGEDFETSDKGEWQAPWSFADDDTLVALHVASHLVLYAAIALHVGFALKHQLVDRDRFLRRML
ncbi:MULTISPECIES: cytochrome b [Mumia]|uniref:Cytochrome b n=1 Tax=Mumia xiangluensis TaxID=1678900 RepID=A0ABW1QK26_9ACTN|nr:MULTISPECIES: cytochrome b/b6 domain-containing protein [Mumia]